MTTPVSFELAKLLKGKGYDRPTFDCYNLNGLLFSNGWCEYIAEDPEFDGLVRADKIKEKDVLAPTVAEAVMWLYGNYGIWIKVDVASKDFWHPSIVNIEDGNFMVHPSYVSQKFLEKNGRMFNAPTEAYEAAIDYVLNNLIK